MLTMARASSGRGCCVESMTDTIFALSTGMTRAGLAVFRVSGGAVRSVIERYCGAVPLPRRASLRSFCDPATGEKIDEGLVLFFHAPQSFTGEDVAEFHLHGSLAVIRKVNSVFARDPTLREAESGEFIRRAYEAGRVDFMQVEALSDLLVAETEVQRWLAVENAALVRRRAEAWRKLLIGARAEIEARLDFSDEGDVATPIDSGVERELRVLASEFDSLLKRRRASRILRDGFRIVLLGPPNAGKSTLFNALAARDLAITSPIPGTTRDVLEAALDLDGILVRICDTAGIHDTDAAVEREGIARARAAAREADLVLWLSPADDVVPPPEPGFVAVTTQIDRVPDWIGRGSLSVSAVTGEGIEALLARLRQSAFEVSGASPGEYVLAQDRQIEAIGRARLQIGLALCYLEDAQELAAEALRRVTLEIDSLTGRIESDEILGAIFSRFCIGK